MAASTCPPHLKAIFPEMPLVDLYGFAYAGGIFREGFATGWGAQVQHCDRAADVAPVDGPEGGRMLSAAVREHRKNRGIVELFGHLPHRDDVDNVTGIQPYVSQSPSAYFQEISRCNVAIHFLSGWNDLWSKDALVAMKNLANPRKLTMGTSSHMDRNGIDLAFEYTRWFDFWLRGVSNGVMDEAPIRYRTAGDVHDSGWKVSWEWPLPEQRRQRYFMERWLHGGSDGTGEGLLSVTHSGSRAGHDVLEGRPGATSGKATRWSSGFGHAMDYGDMSSIRRNGVTYTTEALREDLEVTGHPVLALWVSAQMEQQAVFAYLSEVTENDKVEYVSEEISSRVVDRPVIKRRSSGVVCW